MGVFDKLFGGGILGSAVSGLFGIGQQVMANNYNKKEAEKNRDFQSQEAELNRLFQSNEAALQRDWSSQEAEQARDWQEEMYAKYNSLSGKIAQAEQAGVNPMFAVTGGAVSPMSATSSAPSGASAGSVGTPSGSAASASLVNILGGILDAQRTASETKVNDALAQKYLKEAEESGWRSKLSEREYTIITENDFDIQEIESRIGLNHDNALSAYNLALKYFEEAGKIAEDKDFLVETRDDREKIVEYEKLISEFESSLSSTLDNISSDKESSLKEWFGSILKIILAIKK